MNLVSTDTPAFIDRTFNLPLRTVMVGGAVAPAVSQKMEPFGGEDLLVELTAEDQAAIDALGEDEEVAAAVNEEEEEVADDDEVEVVEE